MQNFFYSSIASIALIVHIIINGQEMVNWRNLKSRPGALDFKLFIGSLLLFFVADILWGVLAEWKRPLLLYIDTIAFFLTMVLTVCAWIRYVVTYLKMNDQLRRCMLWVGRGLLLFFIIALTVNCFYDGLFFYIDYERCAYTAGPLRQPALLLLIALNALCSGMTVVKLLRTEDALHRRNIMVFAFGIMMIAAIYFQLKDPLLPLYSIGCLFGICLLHVFVIEEEHEEMHRKELIARDYEAQLETEREANRAKSLFFSTVSHDLRTPLNAIVGFSELLEQGIADEEERARCVSSIRSSGKVLARLVDDILDLSKMESGKLDILHEPTDIPELAREVIAACEVIRVRKSLVLKSEIGEMPWVSVDPHRIRQILFNLLSNAYKYTASGTITVRVLWQDGTLTLSVADTGKGIAEEDLDRILQPFVQVADKNHRDGTGLGLAICQKLVTLMGGELTVKSEVGVGSTFTITLHDIQTAEPPADHAKDAGDLSEHPAHAISRILIVDDSAVNRAVLKAMLAKCGLTDVAMAANGREALKALKADPNFDLVLSDLWMPEMDGRELVRAIRSDARFAQMPVYLVTADVEARNQAGSDGFSGILLKPITLGKLRELLAA